MQKSRSIALAAVVVTAVASACAARNDPVLRQTSSDGEEQSPPHLDSTARAERPPPLMRNPEGGPPTEAWCDAQPPRDGCHWTLVPTSYCGGPAPPPEMTWPHCSCEPCAADADCGDGGKCDTLAPEGECPDPVRICVQPSRTCTSAGGCSPGSVCNAVGDKPVCRPIVMYPPRP
ncbi:MAG: hypothetical protein U0414_38330 [Polyangiaceae bacterium]